MGKIGWCDMSEYKCCASINGVCRNVYGYGTKCTGYSKECSLRTIYESRDKMARKLEIVIRRNFGIKGDCE